MTNGPLMKVEERCAIVSEPLDVQGAIDLVRTDACGAVVTFLGVARSISDDGRAVDGLTYEAFRELALSEMLLILEEAERAFDGVRLAVVHRVGSLRLGEASVAIAAAAPHRAAAFDACEYAIDQLKARVPIWKKEHYTGGETRWRENATQD